MREGGEEGRRGHKAPEVGSCKNRLDPGRISHGLSIHLPIPAGVSAGRHCWTKALGGEGEDSEQGAEGCEVQRCSGAASMPTPHPLPLHRSPAPALPARVVSVSQGDRQTRSGKACCALSFSRSRTHTHPHTHPHPPTPGIHQHRHAYRSPCPPRQPARPAHWASRSAPILFVDIKCPLPFELLCLCLIPSHLFLFIT